MLFLFENFFEILLEICLGASAHRASMVKQAFEKNVAPAFSLRAPN